MAYTMEHWRSSHRSFSSNQRILSAGCHNAWVYEQALTDTHRLPTAIALHVKWSVR